MRRVRGPYPSTPPSIPSGGIVNAASFTPGPIAPGELISIFGSGFGPDGLDTMVIEGSSVTQGLSNVHVTFNGNVGTMIARTPTQINVFVPYTVLQGNPSEVDVVVEVEGLKSTPAKIALANSAPGLSTADASGSGQGAILNQDGTYNGPTNPADRGSVVTLFGTGEGAITPELYTGALVLAQPFPKPVEPVSVTIGGQPAEILYAGSAPSLPVGVLQLNVRIPQNISSGDAAVVVSIGDRSTTRSVTVAVR